MDICLLDLLSQLYNMVASGLQAGIGFVYDLGQSAWGMLTGAGGNEGRVVGRRDGSPSTNTDHEGAGVASSQSPESTGSRDYRRQVSG